jgi:hypothetical protein
MLSAMRLYDFLPSGNGYKVRLALRWLGIPFEYHEIDILKGESRTLFFLAKNAFGQIPVLELDDGTCLRESTVVLPRSRAARSLAHRRDPRSSQRMTGQRSCSLKWPGRLRSSRAMPR